MFWNSFAHWSQLAASARWLVFADMVALVGVLVTAWMGWRHFRASRGEVAVSRNPLLQPITWVALAMGVVFVSVWFRAVEVNHFPSQTMGEVLVMFTFSLLVSMVVLHFALALQRRGPGWAILNDALILLILASVPFTHTYVRGLSSAQRDLPPALQSYWFAPHLSSLIFSYATLGIAGLICLIYFVTRFWTGVFVGGFSKKSQLFLLLFLVILPFAQLITIPVLALSGLVFFWMVRTGRLPDSVAVAKLEKELDDVSFRAFAVGMPFLTAGLWMGAFWAQEAWANYWGWDSKENSALISWLVYVVYIHLRMLGGYRGEKAMAVLMGGALSIFMTFQLFGYLPDSQKSLHRYTDDAVTPIEGMQGAPEASADSASVDKPQREAVAQR